MSEETITGLEQKIDTMSRDISEIKEVLKGNQEYAESGLSQIVRHDHEGRIQKIEAKLIYVAGFAVGMSAVASVIVSLIFKTIFS